MGKLHKKLKKTFGQTVERKLLGKDTYDTLHPMGTTAEAQFDAAEAAKKAATEAENEPVIPLPDEEELEKARRRRAKSRRGSRASTVLTDDDQLGP